VGFIVAGVALILNLRAGYSPAHYGLALCPRSRQVARRWQIALRDPRHGALAPALFGFHFYTWAFVYGALVVYCGAMLMLAPTAGRSPRPAAGKRPRRSHCGCWYCLRPRTLAAFLAECGLGPCRTIRRISVGSRAGLLGQLRPDDTGKG
jgi:hypothetical protein